METGEKGRSLCLLPVVSPGEPHMGRDNHGMDSHFTEGVYPEETMSPQDTEHAF